MHNAGPTIIGHNSNYKIVSFSGITPLHIAMMNDDKPCVDALLRHGADPKMLVRLLSPELLSYARAYIRTTVCQCFNFGIKAI